ncbi:hypothetical protein [Nostoc sp. 'Peltigera membranacea cyanobiont' N6]|uniref:hypothetical protein n=1 Tax=Nostoc sp. 'Peltigera membranacea cyanobiont' N6 TaxID=1261031 RepID=UPI0011B096B9|nr:hypothetical protein [Nostoc sp. 'Peltigera membranacea cyanobiont' N6]
MITSALLLLDSRKGYFNFLNIFWGKGSGNVLVCHWIFTLVNLFVMIPSEKCDRTIVKKTR